MQNALQVVDYLNQHPRVKKVNHPALKDNHYHDLYSRYFKQGAGSIFTFEIAGSREDTLKFIDSLDIFSLLANVADVKSLVIHPANTTYSQLNEIELANQGLTQTTVRLSIGIENIKDIIKDLDQALANI